MTGLQSDRSEIAGTVPPWLVDFEVVSRAVVNPAVSARVARKATQASWLGGVAGIFDGQSVFAAETSHAVIQETRRQGSAKAFMDAWATELGPVATLSLAAPDRDGRSRVCGWAHDSIWDTLATAESAPHLLLCERGKAVLELRATTGHRSEIAVLLNNVRAAPVLAEEQAGAEDPVPKEIAADFPI